MIIKRRLPGTVRNGSHIFSFMYFNWRYLQYLKLVISIIDDHHLSLHLARNFGPNLLADIICSAK